MSGGFALILIAGIVLFATGMGGSFAIPLMAIGAIGLAVSSFKPASGRRLDR